MIDDEDLDWRFLRLQFESKLIRQGRAKSAAGIFIDHGPLQLVGRRSLIQAEQVCVE